MRALSREGAKGSKMSQITNLSANNSAGAIRRYRDNYDQAFGKPTTTDRVPDGERPISDTKERDK